VNKITAMNINSPSELAGQSRERQLGRKKKILNRAERRKLFDARLAIARANPASNLLVKQLPPGPEWTAKKKKQKAYQKRIQKAQLDQANHRIKYLESQVANILKTRDKADFYNSPGWQKTRYEALKRHNGRCELCGASKATGAVIQVDHIKPRSIFPEIELDPNNLQVLCRPCNMGKSNRDSIDWRKPELQVVRGV